MLVRQAIKQLTNGYDLDDSIVVAWWDREAFDIESIDKKQWENIANVLDDTDWSYMHDELDRLLQRCLAE
jgi:hypothetical protein